MFDNKKSQSGFAVIELALVFLIISLIALAGWFVYQKRGNTNENAPYSLSSKNSDVQSLEAGKHEVTMLPFTSQVNLPSGATLQFKHAGKEDLVPDFVFGDKYSEKNNIEKNYIPIKRSVSTYHNGYAYNMSKKKCNLEPATNSDVANEMRIVNCVLTVEATKSAEPVVDSTSFGKEIIASETLPIFSSNELSNKPLLRIASESNPSLRIYQGKPVLNGVSDPSINYTWDIDVMTNYGVSTIKYSAEELNDRRAKSVRIGKSEVEIVINSLVTNKTKIGMTINYKSLESGEPIKIIEYQE